MCTLRDLPAAICAILTQPALSARLGSAARKRVEAEFTLERAVERLEALCLEVFKDRDQEVQHG